MMDPVFIVSRIAERTGLDEQASGEALRVTLAALGDVLTDDEVECLASAIGGSVGRTVRERARESTLPIASGLSERVAELAHTSISRAHEETLVVCGALAEAIGPESLAEVQSTLPPSIANYFVAREHAHPAPAPRVPGSGHTLATGRVGSAHPLSESRPPEKGHAHSVARSDEPHAESQVATSHGLTQERVGESLAEGRPGSSRPLHGATDRGKP